MPSNTESTETRIETPFPHSPGAIGPSSNTESTETRIETFLNKRIQYSRVLPPIPNPQKLGLKRG